MRKLGTLVGKNLKILIRAKASSLVIVLGPLLLVFLAGLAFDNSDPYALRVGAYAPTYTDTVLQIFDGLRDRFSFAEYTEESTCEEDLRQDRIHACILFPDGFAMGRPGYNEIVVVTDYSRVNLAGTIMTVIDESVGEDISNISFDLTEELVDSIDFTRDRVKKQRDLLVRLTTENQLISESGRALSADLSDIDLSFDPAEFATSNLSSSKKKIEHWVTNAFTLAQTSLTKASSFISDAEDATDEEDREQYQESLESSVDKIAKLREDLATSKDLAETNFADFDQQLSKLITDLQGTKAQLEHASASRDLGLRVVDAVLALLDNSLINLLQVQMYLNEIDARLDNIRITDPGAIVQPIVTSVRPVVAESSYLNYIFPSLIILVIMFTSLLIAPTLVQLHRHSPAFFRSMMAPVNSLVFYLSKFLTCLILLAGQLLIILSVASVVFSAEVLSSLPIALFILLFVCLLFISVGLLLGYLFHSEQTAILGGISLGAVFLFLSDLIIPIESMPLWIRTVADFSPFVVASDLLRGVVLFGSFSLSDFGVLLAYVVVFVVLSMFVSRSKKTI